MSKLELQHILGSSSSKHQLLGYAQDNLLYVSGSYIIFYNPVVDQQIAYLKHNSPQISCIAVSPCQQYLAISSSAYSDKQKTLQSMSKKNNHNISIYRLGQIGEKDPTINMVLKGHRFVVNHMIFSPDSKHLVTVCNKDMSMFVWDCEKGERLTQNKNNISVNSIKFIQQKDPKSVSLMTCGKSNFKIWPFYAPQTYGTVIRAKEQEHHILTGRTISFNRLIGKQLIDMCCWQNYFLLLTADGMLFIVGRTPKQQKLEKCIDLVISKPTNLQIYHNSVLCGGENALIKIIDLESLTQVGKFPKPPPINKENISKDYEDQQLMMEYQQSQQFPRCVGIKTIGNNRFSQFIVTLYSNLTMFIWRPQPQEIVAMRSIITHRSSIKSVTILQQFKDDLTFFSTISDDNTLRIWHIYKKCFHNRESIDIAQLIGIKRNAYCRNLTRIIYMQSQKQVTCIAGFCKKSIACIAHRQFMLYSLSNFEVVCYQVLDSDAVALEIKDNVAYIGLENCKVVLYQILEQEDRLNKIRQIQFQNKIKSMKIINDDSSKSTEPLLLIQTADSNQVILYSLKKSKVVYVQKGVKCCSTAGHHIVMCKSDQTIFTYNITKGKSSQLLSLKHEIGGQTPQEIVHVACNQFWIMVITSNNKLIVTNFSSTIVCTEQFSEAINDLVVNDSGEVIMVGDYGNILIYRMQGNSAYSGMEQEVKKWMNKNDMSWMEGSVWAKKKSNVQGDRQLSGSVIDSIRLRSSVNNRGSVRVVQELPNMQIKYKSGTNDESVFNPSDILKQAKQIYNKMDVIEKKKNNSNLIGQPDLNQNRQKPLPTKKQQEDDGLQQIMINRNINKKKPPNVPNQVQNQPAKLNNSKKRIFGLSLASQHRQQTQIHTEKSQQEKEEGIPLVYKNNLVNSVIHQGSPDGQMKSRQASKQKQQLKQKEKGRLNSNDKKLSTPQRNIGGNYSQFIQSQHKQSIKTIQPVREAGEISRLFEQFQNSQLFNEKQMIIALQQKINNKQFLASNSQQLQKLYNELDKIYRAQRTKKPDSKNQTQFINRAEAANYFTHLSKQFMEFLQEKKQ